MAKRSKKEPEEGDIRDQIVTMIQKAVALKTGSRIDQATANSIFEASIEMFLTFAVENGYARLPGGYGSFWLRDIKPSRYKHPVTGEMRESPAGATPKILKYVEGLAVRDMLGKPDKHPGRTKPRTSAVSELFLNLGVITPPV